MGDNFVPELVMNIKQKYSGMTRPNRIYMICFYQKVFDNYKNHMI